MQTFLIIWLIAAIIATILVIAALVLSSRISEEEGIAESYEDWEANEPAQEMNPRQAEQ